MKQSDKLRDHLGTVLFTLFFSLCSTGFTTWVTVRDLKLEVTAQAKAIDEGASERKKLQEDNQMLAVAVAKLTGVVELLTKQVERLADK